jgi:hypothetical protein
MRNVHVSMYLYGLHTGNKNGVPCVELFCLCDDTFTKKKYSNYGVYSVSAVGTYFDTTNPTKKGKNKSNLSNIFYVKTINFATVAYVHQKHGLHVESLMHIALSSFQHATLLFPCINDTTLFYFLPFFCYTT